MSTLFLAAAVISLFPADIISYDAAFDMTGPASGTLTVSETILVNNAAGEDAATIVLHSDHFCSVSSFSGVLTGPTGNETKIKKKDLFSFSPLDAIGTDTYIHTYTPSSAYPYVIHYDYVLSFSKGILSFPDFLPVTTKNTALHEASYSLAVPPGTQIQTFSSIGDPIVTKGEKDIYQWTIKDVAGIVNEKYLPPMERLLPIVKTAPVEFKYGRFSGRQNTWNELGHAFSELVNLADGLPEEALEEAREITADCDSPVSKINALYQYLRKKTRYVSISFGIGGYEPHDASMVYKTGFGDCKDLSNFMKNLLKAVGIDSYYSLIDTYDKEIDGSTVSATAFNHAVLAVPTASDTLWLECTNTAFPFGYRHSGIAGHQLLLVNGEDSHLIKAREYTAEENSSLCEYWLDLADGQSETISCSMQLSGMFVEPYIGFQEMGNRDKIELMSARMRYSLDKLDVSSFSDNFHSYSNADYIPHADLNFNARCNSICRKRGDMLFVNGTLSSDFVFNMPAERHNDIYIQENCIFREIVHIKGGDISNVSLPQDYSLECPEAVFCQNAEITDDTITLFRSLSFREGTYPKDDYELFRSFLEKVTKVSTSAIVFK